MATPTYHAGAAPPVHLQQRRPHPSGASSHAGPVTLTRTVPRPPSTSSTSTVTPASTSSTLGGRAGLCPAHVLGTLGASPSAPSSQRLALAAVAPARCRVFPGLRPCQDADAARCVLKAREGVQVGGGGGYGRV